jgi:hypothetical protein
MFETSVGLAHVKARSEQEAWIELLANRGIVKDSMFSVEEDVLPETVAFDKFVGGVAENIAHIRSEQVPTKGRNLIRSKLIGQKKLLKKKDIQGEERMSFEDREEMTLKKEKRRSLA